MTKLYQLDNPQGNVTSAWITSTMIGATLNVATKTRGSEIIAARTLAGAKQIFGRDFQKGGRWKTNEQH